MKVSSLNTILPVAAVAAITLASPAAANPLTGQEFSDLHAGKCLTYTGPTTGTQCYDADGSTRYTDTTYGSDTGDWGLQGNDICVRYVNDPEWDCGPVSSAGNGQYTDGTYTWTID